MKVVDLHPEDLLDKLSAGELTQVEHERLSAHLAQCSVCRFEVGVRAELEREMSASEVRPQLDFPAAIERTPPADEPASVAVSPRARARRRWPLAMLAAALVLCAGGAAAAVLSGSVQPHWLPWASVTQGTHATPAAKPGVAAAKAKRVPKASDVSGEARSVASAEQSAFSLPSVSAEPTVATAPVVASRATAQAKGAPKATPVASSNAHAGTNVVGVSAPTSTGAANPRFEASLRGEDRPPRVDAAAALFADANRARRDGNAERAVRLYRTLQNRYPSAAESALSRALLGQLLLDRGNPEAALADFDRYLSTDAPALGAEALVGRARALEQLGKSAQAAAAWREVQTRFAGSVHARLAAARLAALGMR